MKLTAALLFILFTAAFPVLAQNPPAKKTLEIPVVEAKPEDVGSLDGIIKAFYDVVSGGVGVPRQWSRDKTLYIPEVRFVAMSERNGKIIADVMTHQEYAEGGNDFLVKEGFVEKEIKRVTQRFGNVAQILSIYEFSTSGERKIKGRGINTINLFFDGKRWWISAVAWDEERPNNPIPKEFLP